MSRGDDKHEVFAHIYSCFNMMPCGDDKHERRHIECFHRSVLQRTNTIDSSIQADLFVANFVLLDVIRR